MCGYVAAGPGEMSFDVHHILRILEAHNDDTTPTPTAPTTTTNTAAAADSVNPHPSQHPPPPQDTRRHRWLAENLSTGERGLIPNEAALLAAQEDWPPREARPTSLISRLLASKVHSASQSSLSSSTSSLVRAYVPVQMRKADATMLRPVVILGPAKDLVIDRLVLHYHPDVFLHTCTR